jgi:hypothetical protein
MANLTTVSQMDKLKVLCLTWDTNGSAICEKSQNLNVNTYTQVKSKLVKDCINIGAGFIEKELYNYVMPNLDDPKERIQIIHVSTQEEPSSQSYLHSSILPQKLGDLGYVLFKRFKNDVGEIQSGGINATNTSGSLRVSTYIHQSSIQSFREGEKSISKYVNMLHISKTNSSTKQENQFRFSSPHRGVTYGGICTYLYSKNYGTVCFIDVDFPYGNKSFLENMSKGYGDIQRQLYNKITINNMLEFFVHAPSRNEYFDVHFLFIMGEMKSSISEGNMDTLRNVNRDDLFSVTGRVEDLVKKDDIYKSLKGYPFMGGKTKWFHEGVNNRT